MIVNKDFLNTQLPIILFLLMVGAVGIYLIFPFFFAQKPINPQEISIGIVGNRSSDLERLIKDFGFPYKVIPYARIMEHSFDRYTSLFFTAPDYPEKPLIIAPALKEKTERFLANKRGVFMEFSSFPGQENPEPKEAFRERLFVDNSSPLTRGIPYRTILEEHQAYYVPLSPQESAREVLTYGLIGGTYRAFFPIPKQYHYSPYTILSKKFPRWFEQRQGTHTWSGLSLSGYKGGRLVLAATSLSDFRSKRYKPQIVYEKLMANVIAYLNFLPTPETLHPVEIHTEPRNWANPKETVSLVVRAPADAQITSSLLAKPLKRGPDGYFRAVLKLPEGTHSIPVSVQRGKIQRSFQTEIEIRSQNAQYQKSIENNLRWLKGMLVETDGSGGIWEHLRGQIESDGSQKLAKSFTRTDCTFESALAFYLGGKFLKQPKYEDIGLNLVRKWLFNPENRFFNDQGVWSWYAGSTYGFYPDDFGWDVMMLLSFYRFTGDTEFLKKAIIATEQGGIKFMGFAHYDSPAILAYIYAYTATGEKSYLEKARQRFDSLLARDPMPIRNNYTSDMVSLLMPLPALIQYFPEYKKTARDIADKILRYQMPCGAIREIGNNRSMLKVSKNDGAIFHRDDEYITDQLYTNNFALFTFYNLYKVTGDDFYRNRFLKLADFLVRIQNRGKNPQLFGGWLRGFDIKYWEPYGSNVDSSYWGVYCMETGWTNAIINFTLNLYLNDIPFLPKPGELDQKIGQEVLLEVRRETPPPLSSY